MKDAAKVGDNTNLLRLQQMFKTQLVQKVQDNQKQPCLFYPENDYKANWDFFMTIVLIFTCIVTPARIALIEG